MASSKILAMRLEDKARLDAQFNALNTTVVVQEGIPEVKDANGKIIKAAIPEIKKYVPLDADGKPDAKYITE